MTFFSDVMIKQCVDAGRIVINPYDSNMVQPASIDLRLDRHFKIIHPRINGIDPKVQVEYDSYEGDSFELGPYGFCLASTIESITLPSDIVARLEGKSSLGRLGLTAHITAGFFDPGFSGHATLELFNANNRAFKLHAGMPICQMSFALLGTPSHRPYGHNSLDSKYQHAPRGPQDSQMHRNF